MSTPHVPKMHWRRPPFIAWLVAVIGLAAALVVLGAWVLVDRETNTPEGLAPGAVVTMLEDRIAAMNSRDGEAAAAFYRKDAVMEERDMTPALVTEGRERIAGRLHYLADNGLRVEPVGAPVQMGRYVGEAVRFYEFHGTGTGEGILVFELDKSGKIAHQWIMGETRP